LTGGATATARVALYLTDSLPLLLRPRNCAVKFGHGVVDKTIRMGGEDFRISGEMCVFFCGHPSALVADFPVKHAMHCGNCVVRHDTSPLTHSNPLRDFVCVPRERSMNDGANFGGGATGISGFSAAVEDHAPRSGPDKGAGSLIRPSTFAGVREATVLRHSQVKPPGAPRR